MYKFGPRQSTLYDRCQSDEETMYYGIVHIIRMQNSIVSKISMCYISVVGLPNHPNLVSKIPTLNPPSHLQKISKTLSPTDKS
jgi:hypothetical protein